MDKRYEGTFHQRGLWTADKHMKGWEASLVFREMQIKAKMSLRTRQNGSNKEATAWDAGEDAEKPDFTGIADVKGCGHSRKCLGGFSWN